ncbi:hypothetical protein [Listeria cornellensis]|nr:hypothetical protein [Listeria cornellensis]
MKNGQLENYFVHRMVSGRIWRDIKDKNTVTVLSDKVQRLLITSYIFSMIGILIMLIWIACTNFGNGYLWPSIVFFIFLAIAIVFQTLANKAFKQECSNRNI